MVLEGHGFEAYHTLVDEPINPVMQPKERTIDEFGSFLKKEELERLFGEKSRLKSDAARTRTLGLFL